ncbi:polysaccharide lyase family 8 super-sandwich domain-containing protein [uncultured Parabacteroides sp.]|uniref:polysaccharide lyase family 8 super-sandwich domain-containing protein n=1 Tax=uncultured Parabacteroides sp. TaxID=512312 RepID=UPI002805CF0B|nr:polysaccharide lyase family 8 super-sandwich domain-containing protein [uncultured Parabacteroides sp.]
MKTIYSIILVLFVCLPALAEKHPHILVKDEDKAAVLDKIEKQAWAKQIFNQKKDRLDGYVVRHQTEPDWILDRYLMNRIPGKRYTRFISDKEGTQLIGYEGDAPVPTVRVSPHKRSPITPQGRAYVVPEIEDVVPKDTSMTMNLLNPGTQEYERVDPQAFVAAINGKINTLAYEASVIYWLTGDEKYAKFAADILNQWVSGVVYQEPIDGPGRTGFLDIQTLGDEKEKPLILAYDFLYPYLVKYKYPLENYDKAFEKVAWTLSFRGYAGNNWFAAESSTLVAAALSLKDARKRNYYLDFYLNRDTVVEGCGQLSLPSAAKLWFTPDGHWKEPGGYHNYPVSKLIEAALMLENNGYQIFNQYPILLKASYVMLKYSFPDLTASAFGDTGRPCQSMECLESAILMADKYQLPILPDLLNAAMILEQAGQYDRSKSGLTGLLCYLPELPKAKSMENHLWNRSEKLDFASCYLQRNGIDPQYGLMCVVQGATYNHNHSNGMSMELYGAGAVQGIDPGNGPTYEHPMHVNYYTQWAAHNTVVAAGASTSVTPFNGGGGTKKIGQVELVSMEPLAGEKAISDEFSYTWTKYKDGSTETNQDRLLSILRIDEKHGFYVDFYRSDNAVSNDYLYHNIGDSVILYTQEGKILKQDEVHSYPCVGKDRPGLRYFRSVRTTGVNESAVVALFSARQLNTGASFMKMWMPASSDVSYFTALAPEAKTASSPYQGKPSLVVTMRKEKPAVREPFVAVYEPVSKDLSAGSIVSVERIKLNSKGKDGCAVKVNTKDGDTFTLVNSLKDGAVVVEDQKCNADFAIFAKRKGKNIVYVGNGAFFENKEFKIESEKRGGFYMEYDQTSLLVRSNCPIKIQAKNGMLKEPFYLAGGERVFKNQSLRESHSMHSDIEKLRKRFAMQLLDAPVSDERIKTLVETLQPDGRWPGIDYVDTTRTAFQHERHLSNMLALSIAYKKKGSPYKGNKQVRKAVHQALAFWLENDFICENWWWNQIGTPNTMVSMLLILDRDLSQEESDRMLKIAERGNMNASGARPSGDRIKIAGLQAKAALFKRDAQEVAMLMKIIEGEIKFSTGRGMQHDFSFHHRTDWVNNTLSYGSGYAGAFIEWASNVADTEFRFSEQTVRLLIDYYIDGICKQMVYGRISDPGILNRDIARPGEEKVWSPSAPEKLRTLTNYRQAELDNIICLRKGDSSCEPVSFAKFFWRTDHFVFQRPNFYTSVRMYSTRNANMEMPYNGEGLMNHFRGDGTNYLSIRGDEYKRLTPVYDWMKIPGATIVQLDKMPGESEIQKWGLTDYVGAVTDGMYGAVGFDFKSPHTGLAAKKAWFFFDKAYVCLGTNISSRMENPVLTTVNQCLLNGEVTVSDADGIHLQEQGTRTKKEVRWVVHDKVGYYFLQKENVVLSNQRMEGSWKIANRQTTVPADIVRQDVFTLSIDHGQSPDNGGYAYMVIPSVDSRSLENRVEEEGAVVLANSSELQAVRHDGLNMAYAVFYKGGTLRINDKIAVEIESPGMLMMKYNDSGEIQMLAVSDPTHFMKKLHLSVNQKIDWAAQEGIQTEWDKEKAFTRIVVDLPQDEYAGKSVIYNK